MEDFVFISYSTADSDAAFETYEFLKSLNIDCWIAPREIKIGERWGLSIMKALQSCSSFVVLVSKHSMNSSEVLKEIIQATRLHKRIFCLRLDKSDFTEDFVLHLSPYHWLDASSAPLESHLLKLSEEILSPASAESGFFAPQQMRLREHFLYPKPIFAGRKKELKRIVESFQNSHVVFLCGMGGIGKSELAKAYSKKYCQNYDTIIFAKYNTNLLELVTSDVFFIENFEAQYPSESSRNFFFRKLEAIKKLSNSRTLIILDNFDTEYDELFDIVASGPYHLLVTSRIEPSDYPVVPVGKIRKNEKIQQIFLENYGKKICDMDLKYIDKILHLVNFHTLTVELVAKQMRASHISASEMLHILENDGLDTKLSETVYSENNAFDYLCKVFSISNLDENEIELLQNMCLLPFIGMDLNLFHDVCELETYDSVNTLLSKSWILLDEDTNMISLHPVIHDVLCNKLSINLSSCRRYIRGLILKLGKEQEIGSPHPLVPYLFFVMNHYSLIFDELMAIKPMRQVLRIVFSKCYLEESDELTMSILGYL